MGAAGITLFCVLFVHAPVAQQLAGSQHVVAPGGDPLRLMLQGARNGDTLRVASGVHRGNFTVMSRVTLLGEPGAVLEGERSGTVLTLRADSVRVSGLTIAGSGRSLDSDLAAVRIEHCRGCSIDGISVERSLHGIYLVNTHGSRIANSSIVGDSSLSEARRGNGIHLFNSTGNTIVANRVVGTRDGIYFSFASRNRIDSNFVTGVRYGLHYMYSDDNTFEANVFTRNAAGAAIMFSNNISLLGNEFSRHVGYRAYGLLLQTASNVKAERNELRGNLIAVFVDNSNRLFFRGNIVEGNGVGIDLLPSARDNLFAGNSFAYNRTPVRIARGSGKSSWSENGTGNYWGARATFDLDRDGIGEAPLRVGDAFATLAQARPALEAFAGTPAARALSWAEEAFPAFQSLRVEDPTPIARFGPEAEGGAAGRLVFAAGAGLAFAGLLVAGMRRMGSGTRAFRREVRAT